MAIAKCLTAYGEQIILAHGEKERHCVVSSWQQRCVVGAPHVLKAQEAEGAGPEQELAITCKGLCLGAFFCLIPLKGCLKHHP